MMSMIISRIYLRHWIWFGWLQNPFQQLCILKVLHSKIAGDLLMVQHDQSQDQRDINALCSLAISEFTVLSSRLVFVLLLTLLHWISLFYIHLSVLLLPMGWLPICLAQLKEGDMMPLCWVPVDLLRSFTGSIDRMAKRTWSMVILHTVFLATSWLLTVDRNCLSSRQISTKPWARLESVWNGLLARSVSTSRT